LYVLSAGILFIFLASVITPKSANWENANILLLSLSHSAETLITSISGEAQNQTKGFLTHDDANQESYESSAAKAKYYCRSGGGEQRNVLLIILEGIPGAYISGIQEYMGIDYPGIICNAFRRLQQTEPFHAENL
jgi:hypothetical protein